MDEARRAARCPAPPRCAAAAVCGRVAAAGALARPAVAAACATGIAGVLVGLWLGHASAGLEGPASYAESTLIEAAETSVTATFATSFVDPIEDIDSMPSP